MMCVLDACALLAYLRGEDGAQQVADLLVNQTCCVHPANLCEVFYGYSRERGESAGYEALETLQGLGLMLFEETDLDFWMQAGIHKVRLGRISLADCLCLTLAQRLDAELITSDHHEFDQVAQQNLCRVRFIR